MTPISILKVKDNFNRSYVVGLMGPFFHWHHHKKIKKLNKKGHTLEIGKLNYVILAIIDFTWIKQPFPLH